MVGLAVLAGETLAVSRSLPTEGWATAFRRLALPAALAALAAVYLAAAGSKRGGPLLLAITAFATVWAVRGATGSSELGSSPPVTLIERRFVPLPEPGAFLYVDRIRDGLASDAVIIDAAAPRGQWRMTHHPTVAVDELALVPEPVLRSLIAGEPEIGSLQSDMDLITRDLHASTDRLEAALVTLAPIAALAGFGLIARISRWPLLGSTMAFALSRGVLFLYRVAGDPLFERVAALMGRGRRLFPAAVLLLLGLLMILADLLSSGHREEFRG